MAASLDIPWDRIRKAAEEGAKLTKLAELFKIKATTIRVRACRQKWDTPQRFKNAVKAEIERREDGGERVETSGGWSEGKKGGSPTQKPAAGGQEIKVPMTKGGMVAGNQSLTDQLEVSNALRKSRKTLLPPDTLDYEEAARTYRSRGVHKLGKILDDTVISPPRNWRDFDIADKMMRRLLGLDEGENKLQTVVQLQVVNERLTQSREDIVEGEIVTPESPDPLFHVEQSAKEPDSVTSYNRSNV